MGVRKLGFVGWVCAVLAMFASGCGNDSGLAAQDEPTPTATPAVTPTPPDAEPAWQEMRGAVHVHSVFSHDACDGNGLPGGLPDPLCMAQLRDSLCGAGFAFVGLTDHPSFMRDHAFVDDLLFDASAGDVLVEEGGEAIANRMACPGGATVLVTAGYEANHTMPIGLKGHLPTPELYSGVDDAMLLADAQALVDGLKAGGAVTALAHSEGEDLSAQRIVDAGFEAMEWYNPHGNFKTVLGGDTVTGDPLAVIDLVKSMESFLLGSDSGASADLLYLLLLPEWPQAGFDKWREVNRQASVTGLLGSDVHQNVSVDPVCGSDPGVQALCAVAAAAWPNALTLLLSGGQITLADGERIDGYDRIFRWLDNRVLATEATHGAITQSIRDGRSFGVFRVFGEPEGFAFTADFGDGVARALGADREGPATMRVVAPIPEAIEGGAPFTPADAGNASVRITLLRTDAAGTVVVRDEVVAPGAVLEQPVADAGAYSVEIHVTPHHLATALGDESALADIEYLWVITNPIRVR